MNVKSQRCIIVRRVKSPAHVTRQRRGSAVEIQYQVKGDTGAITEGKETCNTSIAGIRTFKGSRSQSASCRDAISSHSMVGHPFWYAMNILDAGQGRVTYPLDYRLCRVFPGDDGCKIT